MSTRVVHFGEEGGTESPEAMASRPTEPLSIILPVQVPTLRLKAVLGLVVIDCTLCLKKMQYKPGFVEKRMKLQWGGVWEDGSSAGWVGLKL